MARTALPPYSGQGLYLYLELFLFNHGKIQHGVDHRSVPHERLGINSVALALAHREYHLDQSIAKRPRINQRHGKSFRQIVVGLIHRGRTQAHALSAVFRDCPLACASSILGKTLVSGAERPPHQGEVSRYEYFGHKDRPNAVDAVCRYWMLRLRSATQWKLRDEMASLVGGAGGSASRPKSTSLSRCWE